MQEMDELLAKIGQMTFRSTERGGISAAKCTKAAIKKTLLNAEKRNYENRELTVIVVCAYLITF